MEFVITELSKDNPQVQKTSVENLTESLKKKEHQSAQSTPENRTARILSNSLYEAGVILISGPDKYGTKWRKLQTNNSLPLRHNYPQIMSKLSQTMNKRIKCNACSTLKNCQTNNLEKSYEHENCCTKSIPQIQHPFMTKPVRKNTLRRLGTQTNYNNLKKSFKTNLWPTT